MNRSIEQVILVDADDREIGQAEKLLAHRLGHRHRAISVCVFDEEGRMLLQRRAKGKYHSAELWTNTCCTHPRPGETVLNAARRRLHEELGVVCELHWSLRTHYRARVGSGLIEDEVVHLFVGRYAGPVSPDPQEVAEYAWRTREDIRVDIEASPESYTYWFRDYIRRHADQIFASSPAGPNVGLPGHGATGAPGD